MNGLAMMVDMKDMAQHAHKLWTRIAKLLHIEKNSQLTTAILSALRAFAPVHVAVFQEKNLTARLVRSILRVFSLKEGRNVALGLDVIASLFDIVPIEPKSIEAVSNFFATMAVQSLRVIGLDSYIQIYKRLVANVLAGEDPGYLECYRCICMQLCDVALMSLRLTAYENLSLVCQTDISSDRLVLGSIISQSNFAG
jgi:hypothetical protein